MITPRPYQEEAIRAVMAALMRARFALLQLPTGAGKTICFAELIRRWLQLYKMRIGILAHRGELVTQARDKLITVWPEAPIGLASAGVSSRVSTREDVTIGTIQTLARRAEIDPLDLIIIDEAHMIDPKGGPRKSQYQKFIDHMEALHPEVRVLGVTATPYRLGHGHIYGNKCRKSRFNWFEKLTFKVDLDDLIDQGYLAPIRAKEAEDISSDLAAIKTTAGDYNQGQLGEMMSRSVHVRTAVKAYEEYGENRQHVLIFCVTIEHAELVKAAFKQAGYMAGVVHSKLSKAERRVTLEAFDRGGLQVLVNVGILTEGWDSPAVDLVMLCRPTKSPALFVQMIGRGTRTAPGKQDVLVLDLGGNFAEHGHPGNPRVYIPGTSNSNSPTTPAARVCPNCKTIITKGLKCDSCGYEWDLIELQESTKPVRMKDVDFGPWLMDLADVGWEAYESRAGNRMLRVSLDVTREGGNLPETVNHFLLLDEESHPYARKRSRDWWRSIMDEEPPETVDEALLAFNPEMLPKRLKVKSDGKYKKVVW